MSGGPSGLALRPRAAPPVRVTDRIRIEAPPDVVWAVTTDVKRWPDWTPTVTAAERLDAGPLRPGSAARLAQPGQPEAVWTVTELVVGERFAWTSRRPGLRLTGTHALRPDGDGTLNELRLDAAGPLAVLGWPLLRPLVARALRDENRGLKAHCERLAAAPHG